MDRLNVKGYTNTSLMTIRVPLSTSFTTYYAGSSVPVSRSGSSAYPGSKPPDDEHDGGLMINSKKS